MKKQELIDAIATRSDISRATAARSLDAATQLFTEALAKGEEVSLAGFGSFKVKERAARTGRNPQTGEAIQIAANRAVVFKPAKALKEAVN